MHSLGLLALSFARVCHHACRLRAGQTLPQSQRNGALRVDGVQQRLERCTVEFLRGLSMSPEALINASHFQPMRANRNTFIN